MCIGLRLTLSRYCESRTCECTITFLQNQPKKDKDKAKGKVSSEVLAARRNLGLLSLKCMAELLSKNYNFNLRSNIVNTLIPYGASKAMGGQLADIVTATIVEVKLFLVQFLCLFQLHVSNQNVRFQII